MKKTIPAIIISTVLLAGGCSLAPATPPTDEPEVQEVTVTAAPEEDPVSDVSGDDTPTEVQEPEIPEEPEEPELPATVTILGTETDIHEQSLDLAAMTPEDVPAVAEAIAQMPELGWINLMNEEGISELSVTDVKALKESAPEVNFIYDFDLFGKRFELRPLPFITAMSADIDDKRLLRDFYPPSRLHRLIRRKFVKLVNGNGLSFMEGWTAIRSSLQGIIPFLPIFTKHLWETFPKISFQRIDRLLP